MYLGLGDITKTIKSRFFFKLLDDSQVQSLSPLQNVGRLKHDLKSYFLRTSRTRQLSHSDTAEKSDQSCVLFELPDESVQLQLLSPDRLSKAESAPCSVHSGGFMCCHHNISSTHTNLLALRVPLLDRWIDYVTARASKAPRAGTHLEVVRSRGGS